MTNNNNMTNLSISRTLTSSEQTKLRTQLYTQLNITTSNNNDLDEDDINDAENIVDYALDMINDGEDVGHVMEEVSEVKKLCLYINIDINHVCCVVYECVCAFCCCRFYSMFV